jgi:hypothetical protein
MRSIVIREAGGPEVLKPEEVPDPEPGEAHVLVRVEAAAPLRLQPRRAARARGPLNEGRV